jgi:hypothetical protein
MHEDTFPSQTLSEPDRSDDVQQVHLYYPAEGLGAIYRRTMLNDFFTDLIHHTDIHTVAEVPLDSYGMIGAGSLIFTQLGCEVTLISDDQAILDRARALMNFNGVSHMRYLHSPLYNITVAADTFDFTWSFDRLQALSDPEPFLQELCRISKATMVIIPNARNYGQYAHYVYHRLAGTTCEFVGPRRWMLRAPIRDALKRGGMTIVADGIIDAPWWPGFPELPNLVRGLLGRAPVTVDDSEMPEAKPQVVPPADVPHMRRQVERSAFFEHGRFWPGFVKSLFSHNVYVIGCKPGHRDELGLSEQYSLNLRR